MSSINSRKFVAWARGRVNDANSRGAVLSLFVLNEGVQNLLFADAVRERITPEDYRVEKGDTFIRGVKVMWTKKLPDGLAWFVYSNPKTEEKKS